MNFKKNHGQGMVEYAIIVSFIIVVVIVIMMVFGPSVKFLYEDVMGEDSMEGYQAELEDKINEQ